MKALIFGVAGQVGQALLASAPAGIEACGLARNDVDLSNVDEIDAAVERHKPDIILNAAAYTAVDRAESDGETAYLINSEAAGAIATASSRIGARMAHISTDFVFDGSTGKPYVPDDTPSPLGIYGASKADGERRVLAAHPQSLIVRTAWVYADKGTNFVETMLRIMARDGTVRVVADQVGSPTHAESLARALWKLAATDECGIFHFTDAGVASWYDFAFEIGFLGEKYGLLTSCPDVIPIATSDYPTPAPRPSYSVLDKSKTWALIGPGTHWRQELETMIQKKAGKIHG